VLSKAFNVGHTPPCFHTSAGRLPSAALAPLRTVFTNHDKLVGVGILSVESTWMRPSAKRAHYVTTNDSVSGSYRTPVPVVTVLATVCMLLLDASLGSLSLSLCASDNADCGWMTTARRTARHQSWQNVQFRSLILSDSIHVNR